MTTILPNWIDGPLTPEKRIGGLGGPWIRKGCFWPRHILAMSRPPRCPGTTMLVGGTGGVSLFALQIGVAAGAQVLMTSSSAQKLARMKELGASPV